MSRPSYPSFPGLLPSLVLYLIVYWFHHSQAQGGYQLAEFFEPCIPLTDVIRLMASLQAPKGKLTSPKLNLLKQGETSKGTYLSLPALSPDQCKQLISMLSAHLISSSAPSPSAGDIKLDLIHDRYVFHRQSCSIPLFKNFMHLRFWRH